MAPAQSSIIETMHRALLPSDLPVLPDLDLSAAYLMMTTEQATCGDWFDAAPLPNGSLGLAVGDVVGDGLEATAAMGRLRTVTLRPRGGVPALEAELTDGSGTLTLIWLGRRRIAGVSPGRAMQVQGRIGRYDGVRTIYNPRYELIPDLET